MTRELSYLPRREPCGVRTERLADVPLDVRLKALNQVMREGLSEEDALLLLDLVLDPGDRSTRVVD